MLNTKHFFRRAATGAAVALATCVLVVDANVPRGWFMAGSKPDEFESGVDSEHAHEGHASAYLKNKQSSVDGFGTLMQSIRAEQYKGKRVRLSGFVNSKEVVGWAGLWMRVDEGKDAIAFDNMQNRPIKGTTNWQQYDVVLDVPQDATGISFGVLLAGTGEVWLSSTYFGVVGVDVPVTSASERKIPDTPVNLEFSE